MERLPPRRQPGRRSANDELTEDGWASDRHRLWRLVERTIFDPSPWPWLRLLATAVTFTAIAWIFSQLLT